MTPQLIMQVEIDSEIYSEKDKNWLENKIFVSDGSLSLHTDEIGGVIGKITKVVSVKWSPECSTVVQWVLFSERKPKKSGLYFFKGKGNYGGRAYFYEDDLAFCFDDGVPTNKIDDDYLLWLDEG